MLIDFPNFEDYLVDHDRESILGKGEKFYHEGLIKHIHAFSGTEWDIFVQSERPNIPGYTIRVRISNNKVTHINCNCQGFRYSQLCKHIVATLFVLREKKLYDESIGDYAYDESDEEEKPQAKKSAEDKEAKGKKKEEMEEETTPAKKKVVQRKSAIKQEKSPQEKLESLEKEFQCEVCSKPFENPVTLPCNTHSACMQCAELILEDAKGKDKLLELKCPSCGKEGGSIKVKSAKELKPNRELERIKRAFEKEKDEWLQERTKLEKELEDLKGKSSQDSSKITEEYKLNKEIKPLDEKTKQAAEDAFFNLKNEGNDVDEFLKQVDDNKQNQEADKENEEKGRSGQKRGNGKGQQENKGKGGKNEEKGGRKSSERGKGKSAEKETGKGKSAEKETGKGAQKNSAKRSHEKMSQGKENAHEMSEGAEKYGLRNKKVKSYAE